MPLLGSLAGGSVKGFGAQANLGYFLGQSLRFRDTPYLSRTPASAGNRKTWTWSGWVKRGNFDASNRQTLFGVASATNDNSWGIVGFETSGALYYTAYTAALNTTALYRDPAAWYHIIVAFDSTQATGADRIKIYVNGVQQAHNSGFTPTLNADYAINLAAEHRIGGNSDNANQSFDGYMGDVYLIDGQALTPSDFGKTDPSTGQWIPKKYAGTYGTNGFKLDFKHQTSASGFNTVLYTGNSGTQSITGVGFSPDLVWVKNRGTTTSHGLFDSVRGMTNILRSDTTGAESDYTLYFSGPDADGFTLPGSSTLLNNSSYNYVAWCWDAGSSTVSNTDGTITSSVRANPATGFSVVTWTGNGTAGATVGHGLSSAPSMIIVKDRSLARNWLVYHSAMGATKGTELNLTNAFATYTQYWNDTAPTSSVFSTGTWSNENASNYVTYCFSEVSGFSKFGSYTGNGSTTGPTITTGFRPAFVLVKSSTLSPSQWTILDNTRSPSNPTDKVLYPNLSNAEADFDSIDFLDDGFQIKNTSGSNNSSGETYIYMAFADTRDTAFWRDKSGTDNHWSLNAINYAASAESTYDLMNDVPTLTSMDKANFATFNPLSKASTQTVSQANLLSTINTARPVFSRIDATMGVTGGKWYFEYVKGTGSSGLGGAGFKAEDTNLSLTLDIPSNTGSLVNTGLLRFGTTNTIVANGLSTATTITGTYTLGDVLGVALDADNGKLYFYLNGVEISGQNIGAGTSVLPTMDSSKTYIPFVYNGNGGSGTELVYNYCNFGQRPFKHTQPTGYKTLNTYNL